MKKFYITTAIAYTTSIPHIGNVYESILSDSIARYKRLDGYDVYFQTGTDEHGLKVEQKASSLNITPKEHVDNISNAIKDIYKKCNISYDYFVRTTDKSHEKIVQDIFKKLYEQNDIYKSVYEGWYCVDCESFYTEKELIDHKYCPDCNKEVKKTKEESYFLKLSKYQDKLLDYINNHPDFIKPETRKNEMVNFIKQGLEDLCVSRTSFKWGIPVTFDNNHVIYVWIDALSNYITTLGYNPYNQKQPNKFNKYWPCDVHVIGKDILRFHTIYWPIILLALNLELPHTVFGHPWILSDNKDKMSKSKNNFYDTLDLINFFGTDRVRYYVLSEIPYQQDGIISYDLVISRANSNLSNTLGNLVSRTLSMSKKYFNNTVTNKNINNEFSNDLINMINNLYNQTSLLIKDFKITNILDTIFDLLRRSNKYIDETTPWILAKDENKKDELETVLYNLLEAIRVSSIFLQPFIPESATKILDMLNIDKDKRDFKENKFNKNNIYNLKDNEILFERLDPLKKLEEIKEYYNKKEESNNLIDINDFDKLELVVGQILEVEKHPNADKLLVLKVNIGNEVRRIVSGIANYYNKENLLNKKVVVLKNLKPVKLRGIESQGMILAASNKNELEVLNIEKLEPGDKIS